MRKLTSIWEVKSDEFVCEKFRHDENLHVVDQNSCKFELPLVQILFNWDEKLKTFIKEFDRNFSIKLLTSEDLEQEN